MSIFLVKGVKLQGVVCAFDNFSVELRRGGAAQLIYKHAISTIAPAELPAEFDPAVLAASDGKSSLQDNFLVSAQQQGARMSLFLTNGVMLDGKVTGFDQYCVVLSRSGQAQMVYKHAISTLQPEERLDSRLGTVAAEDAA